RRRVCFLSRTESQRRDHACPQPERFCPLAAFALAGHAHYPCSCVCCSLECFCFRGNGSRLSLRNRRLPATDMAHHPANGGYSRVAECSRVCPLRLAWLEYRVERYIDFAGKRGIKASCFAYASLAPCAGRVLQRLRATPPAARL